MLKKSHLLPRLPVLFDAGPLDGGDLTFADILSFADPPLEYDSEEDDRGTEFITEFCF